jgi:hypothetical protein
MIDTIGTILIASTIVTLLVGIITSLPIGTNGRLTLAALMGAWLGGAIELTVSGAITHLAVLLAAFALPLVLVAVITATSAKARSAIAAIPAPTIVGLNVMRVMGVFFVFLAVAGRLGGPFPYSAGIGDIITGLFAIPLAWLATRRPVSDPRILAWNAFGFLDLVTAVTLGITSGNGSPLQLIHAGAGTEAIGSLPWSLIPVFLVPLFLMLHVAIFARAMSHAEQPNLASSAA